MSQTLLGARRSRIWLPPPPRSQVALGNGLCLGGCRRSIADQERAYCKFVEEAIRDGHEARFWEKLLGQLALGSKDWLTLIQKGLSGRNREQPQSKAIEARPDLTQVIAEVERLRKLPWEQFRTLRGDWGRAGHGVVFGLAQVRVASAQLGEVAGGADYAAVSAAIKSMN